MNLTGNAPARGDEIERPFVGRVSVKQLVTSASASPRFVVFVFLFAVVIVCSFYLLQNE